MISYDDLALFARVASKQSFTRAAEQLNMPSSTLSRRIARLEDELGTQLLLRTARSVTLTPAGQAYLERCTPGLDALEEATRSLTEDGDVLSGLIRATCPTFFGYMWFGPWSVDFLADHPEVRLDLRMTNAFEDLVAEGIDVAFRVGPLASSTLIARKLWDISYVLCAHHRWAKKAERQIKKEGLEALHNIPCVVTRLMWQFENKQGDKKSISPLPAFRVDDLIVARSAIGQGLGVGYMPSYLMNEATPDVRPLNFGPWRLPSRSVYAVYPASRHLSPKVQRFVSYLEERWKTRNPAHPIPLAGEPSKSPSR